MRFDLTDLRLFIHVTESGSITAGAEHAHLALASASARLRGMEDVLGVPLLLRHRHGVEPTEAGRCLLRHARDILLQMEKMRADLRDYAGGVKGQIRLLANTAAVSEFLPALLADYLAQHPQINLELQEMPSHDIVHALREGMADIGIIADTVNYEGLENFAFRDDRLVVIAAPDHALARAARTARGARGRRGFSLAEIAEHELIGLSGSSALQQHIGQQAATAGQRLRYRLRLPGFESVCRMVASGAGVAIVPEAAALRHAETLGIHHFVLREAWALRKLLVAVHQLDNLPRHARELVAALRT